MAERTTLLIRRFGKRFGRSLEAQNQGHGKPVAPPEFPGLLRIHKDMRNWGNSLFCSDLGGLAVHLSGGLKTATTLGLRFVAVIGTQICKTTGLWRTSRCARRIDNFSLRQWRAIWPETRISILLSSVKYLISNQCCPIKSRIDSIAYGTRGPGTRRGSWKTLLKWGFSRKWLRGEPAGFCRGSTPAPIVF